MKRTIKCDMYRVTIPDDFESNIIAWMENEAKCHILRWLLAHADDGVVWGEMRDDGLHLSSLLFGPELRLTTLQMVRLFGYDSELFLWKNDNYWQARLIKEGEGKKKEYYDENQLLWGTKVEKKIDGFVLLRHGAEGLRHAPPVQGDDLNLPLALTVRHFLDYDPEGQVYVTFSRLVSIGSINQKGEKLNES